jgi:hypothetical protein
MIREAVADLSQRAGITIDPARRGPVPLDRFFPELALSHVALPGLTLGAVVAHLRAEGHTVEDIGDPKQPLAGFLFAAGRIGVAFVKADDPIGRRRFTAAHELGHAVLHREKMGRFILDPEIAEADDATTGIEREANRFAAELLMPEDVIRARAEQLKAELTVPVAPRGVLEYRLAAELLVSAQAIRYRLNALGVGDV